MIIRIIFAGSSALSKRSAKFAETMSRVREKMLIQSLLYSISAAAAGRRERGRAPPGRTASGESLTRNLRRDKSGRCCDQPVRQGRGRPGGGSEGRQRQQGGPEGCQHALSEPARDGHFFLPLLPASRRHAHCFTRAMP